MNKMNPLVSIIIPTLNEEQHIANCLISIQNQDFNDYEIIVIDNGSTDSTKDILKLFRKITIIDNNTIQSAGGSKNIGAHAANGDILIFLDADEVIGDNFILELIKPILDGSSLATVPYIETEKGKELFKAGIFRAVDKRRFFALGGFNILKGYGDDVVDNAEVKLINVPLFAIRTDTLKKQYFKGKWVGNSFHYTGKDHWLGKMLYKIGFLKGIIERKYTNIKQENVDTANGN
jgi:glycosyltransferase involved in cell wall biosynthesis